MYYVNYSIDSLVNKYYYIFYNRRHNVKICAYDVLNILIFVMISLLIRLKLFFNPRNVVFDEIHFGNFTNSYINNNFFFDIHPPFIKMVYALLSYISGYDGSIMFHLRDAYQNDLHYITLRLNVILISSFTASLVYLCVRFGGFSISASFISAFMFCFEISNIIEGRLLLTDGPLITFYALTFLMINHWLNFIPLSSEYRLFQFFVGLLSGVTYSIKYTGLSIVFIIFFVQTCHLIDEWRYELISNYIGVILIKTLYTLLPGLILHYLLWCIHFIHTPILDQTNTYNNSFSALNITNVSYKHKYYIHSYNSVNKYDQYFNNGKNPDYTTFSRGSLLLKFLYYIGSIHVSNNINFMVHPYMTQPIDWPLLTDIVPVYFATGNNRITLIGNPAVYYISFFSVLFLTFTVLLYDDRLTREEEGSLLTYNESKSKKVRKIHIDFGTITRYLVGYASSYIPFFMVPRTLYLYHYQIPLMFACMCTGICLDIITSDQRKKIIITVLLCLTVFYVFTMYSHLIWMSNPKHCPWLRRWDVGKPSRKKFIEKMKKKEDKIKLTDPDLRRS